MPCRLWSGQRTIFLNFINEDTLSQSEAERLLGLLKIPEMKISYHNDPVCSLPRRGVVSSTLKTELEL